MQMDAIAQQDFKRGEIVQVIEEESGLNMLCENLNDNRFPSIRLNVAIKKDTKVTLSNDSGRWRMTGFAVPELTTSDGPQVNDPDLLENEPADEDDVPIESDDEPEVVILQITKDQPAED